LPCAACHELEDKTFSQSEFIEKSKEFILLKVDATEDTEAIQAVIAKYDIKGLPTILFINKKGELLKDLSFTQFLSWPELKPKMLKAAE
jgi:thioredoxin:protein disulfide reductase